MKSLWSWCADPCIHLLLVGLLILHLAFNAPAESIQVSAEALTCNKCDVPHPIGMPCSTVATASDRTHDLD